MWGGTIFLLNSVYLHSMKPTYSIDEKYFEDINDEEKSYFLGLIFADGYVHEKRGYMSLSLQETDVDILVKLKKSIQTNKPLQYVIRKDKNTKNQYRLLITRKKMIGDLINLGVRQNKSLTCTPEKIVDLNCGLIKHFIRGYFDGDGSITYYNVRNTINSTINIVCTKEYYDFFSKHIFEKIGVKSTLSKRFADNKNCFDLRICGNRNVLSFLEYIYSDSSIFLNRKYEKFGSFKETYLGRIKTDMGDKVTILVDGMTFKSFLDASNHWGIPTTTFKRKLKRDPNYLGLDWVIIQK